MSGGPTYRVRPSKPMAIFGAGFGAAIVIFGIVTKAAGFVWLRGALAVAIIAFDLWSAFSRNGHTETITTGADVPPTRPGHTVDRDR